MRCPVQVHLTIEVLYIHLTSMIEMTKYLSKLDITKKGGNFDHSTQHGLKLTSSVMNLFIPQYLIDCLFLFLSCLFPLTDQVFPGCCPMLVTCCCVTPSLEEVAPLLKYDI